jgi:hypothetical protein
MTLWEDILYPVALLSGWSLIYKDNPFWKFFENALVGLGTSITLKVSLDLIQNQMVGPMLQGQLYPSIIGVILGLLVLTRLSEGTKEYSYIPFALMAGVGTAIGAQGAIGPQILRQTLSKPLVVAGDTIGTLNNVLMWTATISVMVYFIFSVHRKGLAGAVYKGFNAVSKVGRYFMMLGFGVTLSVFTIGMGTEMIVYSTYILEPPGIYITVIGIVILVGEIIRSSRKGRETQSDQ